jgi:hypothetical protein
MMREVTRVYQWFAALRVMNAEQSTRRLLAIVICEFPLVWTGYRCLTRTGQQAKNFGLL